MARVTTIRDLTADTGIDPEEALISIWDAGIDDIDDIDTPLPRPLLRQIRRALGLVDPRDLRNVQYWMQHWGLTDEQTRTKLRNEYGIEIGPNARTLPKGALRRMKGEYVSRPQTHPVPEPSNTEIDTASAPTKFTLTLAGKKREASAISADEILMIHTTLVKEFADSKDPIEPPGVRDVNLLESAALRPMTSLAGISKYDTVEGHAAALLHSLIHNHPFHNGNKRTALVCMLVALDRNGILLTCKQDSLFKMVLQVAQHRVVDRNLSELPDREVAYIARWVHDNSRPIGRDDRLVTWRELRKLLRSFDCTISSPMPGNKVRIDRQITKRGLLGRRRTINLHTTTGYRNDGSQVGRRQLQDIRTKLHLSDEHGYDSEYFYGNDSREPDFFIAEYRNLLKRLAKL